ncbi:ROBO4 protein, partial [Aramus guarauna]|nr:ROBO4 protein [Aramus guarauna]
PLPTAALRDNFRLHPGDLVATAGQALELDCVPPSGHPEPRVTWKKDGVTLDLTGDRYAVTNGKLRVAPARRSDSGVYVCVAANAAGEGERRGARVSVLDRLPTGRWEAVPQDLLAMRLHLDNATTLPAAAVQLRWRMLMPAPAPEGYVVLYRCLLPASTSWVQHDAGRLLSTIIPALRRGYKYEFKVRPYAGGTQGLDSNSRHLWIPEEVPSAAPQHVTVGQAEMGNGTVVVSWEPPPPEAHNGIIQGYKIWSMGEGWQHPTNRTVDGGTRHLETLLPGPGAEFCVRVAAFNSAGLGVPSNATCGILERDPHMMPRDPHSMSWDPSPIATGPPPSAWDSPRVLRDQQRVTKTPTLCLRPTPGAMGPPPGYPPLPWDPLCRQQGSGGQTEPRGQGTPSSAPMGALTSLSPPALSLESPSLGPPTPPNHSSLRGGHPLPLGDTGCCGGGHPGVRTSPSTPNPAPWERVRKRGGYGGGTHARGGHGGQRGGGSRLGVAPCRAAPSAQHPGDRGWPRPQPHHRGRRGVGDGFWAGSRVAAAEGTDMSPTTRHPSLVTKHQRDMSPATRHPKNTSPAREDPRDMSPVTRIPKEKSPATRYPKDTSLTTRHPRDRSLLPGRLSPVLSDGVLTPQQVAEDLEMDQDTICPRYTPSPPRTPLCPPAPTTPRSFSPLHTYGYIYGPPASELGEEEEEDEDEEEERPTTRGSPGGSLLNGWGSVSEDNFASARCSLVSSCDGSFLLDASFARALAVAVDGLCFSLEDTD